MMHLRTCMLLIGQTDQGNLNRVPCWHNDFRFCVMGHCLLILLAGCEGMNGTASTSSTDPLRSVNSVP
jgi:hypothetical protein